MSCRVCFAVAIAVTLGSRHATADSGIQLAGTLYKLGSNRQERLYTWEVEACAKVWTSRYRRLDGTLAVEDRTEFAGDRLTGYRYVRHTIGERSSVTVEGQRLRFELERGADRRTETKLTSDVFLAGPAVFRFIQAHLGELAAGRELDFKYGVLDRLDYYSFRLRLEDGRSDHDLRVEISAKSPFVRMAVDPIHVTLSKDGKLRTVSGRTIVMERRGGRPAPIDAELVVESEAPIGCVAAAAGSPSTPDRL